MSELNTKDFQSTQYQFSAYLRDPEHTDIPDHIEARRMAIYRDLFYNNIESFTATAFPVMRQITADEVWHRMIRDFMIVHKCKTPLFHEIAREFLMYLEQERHEETDPVFLAQLAHYEWVELALSVLDSDAVVYAPSSDDDIMSAKLKTSPLAWPLSYDFEVHKIGPDYRPTETSANKVFLLVYRNQDDGITFLELNPISARLIDLLNAGNTCLEAATAIAQELQHPNPDVVIDGAKSLLQDWISRGMIIAQ